MRGTSTDAGSETRLIPGGRCGIRQTVNKPFLYMEIGIVTLVFSGSVSWPRLCTRNGSPRFARGEEPCLNERLRHSWLLLSQCRLRQCRRLPRTNQRKVKKCCAAPKQKCSQPIPTWLAK